MRRRCAWSCTYPLAHSLKDKRAVVRPIVEGSRHRFGVAAAEVGKQDRWQATELAFAAVASTAGHVERGARLGGALRLVIPRGGGGLLRAVLVGGVKVAAPEPVP